MAELKDLGGMVFNSFPDHLKWEAIFGHLWRENFPGRHHIEDEEMEVLEKEIFNRYGKAGVDWAYDEMEKERLEQIKAAEEDEHLWI